MVRLHVVFSDVDPDTGLMRACDLEEAVNRCHKTGLVPCIVLPVHLAGQTAHMSSLVSLAEKYECTIIVDAAHALGSEEVGSVGVGSDQSAASMTCFLFILSKPLQQGKEVRVSTASPELSRKLRQLRNHGVLREPDLFHQKNRAWTESELNTWYYELSLLHQTTELSDLHCALGLSQLRKLDRFLQMRLELVAYYHEQCAPLAPILVPLKDLSVHGQDGIYFLFLLILKKRYNTVCCYENATPARNWNSGALHTCSHATDHFTKSIPPHSTSQEHRPTIGAHFLCRFQQV